MNPREAHRRQGYELLADKCTTADGTRRPWVCHYTREDAIAELETERDRPPAFCPQRWKQILNRLAPHLGLPYDKEIKR